MEPRRVPIDWDDLELALTTYPEVEAGLADDMLVAIEPLPSSVEYEWMAEFADTVAGPRLRPLLQAALGRERLHGAMREGVDIGQGVVVRYDEKKKEVVGLTILGVRARLAKSLSEGKARGR